MFGRVLIRGGLLPQKDPQGAPSINRTILKCSDKTNSNLTRVLDVNPSLFLARKVQPPFIYLRGDGRLNNTNRKTHLLFTLVLHLSLVLLFSRSSLVLLHCRAANLEALGAVRPT